MCLVDFKFNEEARCFFTAQTGVKQFKFTKAMAAFVRQAKAACDKTITVQELLAVYGHRVHVENSDECSYQWNHFLRDFCADPATAAYKEKLKAAALLWGIVRESERGKVYCHELLQFYEQTLQDFL